MIQRFLFHRPQLAESILGGLDGTGLVDYSAGLFLAAPRRTGKSTFLRNDLAPAATQRGWEVVYVDLWANRAADPGSLIDEAIVDALRYHEPRVKRWLKAAGVAEVWLKQTLHWKLHDQPRPEGTTLTQLLQALHEAVGKPVLLIVDESQHALNTDHGMNTMFALKAARDAMNLGPGSDGLRLIFTGSSRDKLASLVLSRDQPFFGNQVTPFPLLGDDFVVAYTEDMNTKLAPGNTFDVRDMQQAFARVGHRPELLTSVVKQVALELGAAPDLGRLLAQGAAEVEASLWAEYEGLYSALTPIQKAILDVLAADTGGPAPRALFGDEVSHQIAERLDAHGGDGPVRSQTIQAGLDALRNKGLVWKSGRGAYALEDSGLKDWLNSTNTPGPI